MLLCWPFDYFCLTMRYGPIQGGDKIVKYDENQLEKCEGKGKTQRAVKIYIPLIQ